MAGPYPPAPDNRTAGEANPPGDNNANSDAIALTQAVLAGFAGYPAALNIPTNNTANATAAQTIAGVVFTGPGLAPSGDTSGVTDTANIQALLNTGSPVQLQAGVFYVDAPLVKPPWTPMRGYRANTLSLTDYSEGTVIKATSSWSQGAAAGNGMLLLLSQSEGSYAATAEEHLLQDFTLDGSANTVSATDGILVIGNVGSSTISRVTVNFPTGIGLHGINDASSNSTGAVWYVDELVVHRPGTNGINFTATDCIWRNCYVIGAGQKSNSDGWVLGTSSNTVLTGCRSEDSIGGNGWVYTSSNVLGNGVSFVGCSTQGNNLNGWKFTATASGANASPVTLTGCRSNDDGQNAGSGGGGYASIFVTEYTSTICITGFTSVPGNGASVNAPEYGIALSSAGGANVEVSASHIGGITNFVSSDGSGTINFDGQCIFETGLPGSSPTVYTPGVPTYTNSAGNLVPALRPDLADLPAGTTGTTVPRRTVTANTMTAASGQLYVNAVYLVAGCPVNNLNFFQGSTIETAGTHGWFVLSDVNRIVRAVTADQTGATFFGTANAVVSLPTTASFTPFTTGMYYIGVATVVSSGNVPNWDTTASVATNMTSALTGAVTIGGTSGSATQTTPPALLSTLATISGVAADQLFGWVT